MIEKPGESPDGAPLGTPENARSREQYEAMQATVGRGVCPFCAIETCKNQPFKQGEFWWIKRNDFPYDRHTHHFLLVARDHMEELSQMLGPMWAELGELITWLETEFRIPGGGIVMRFGNPAYNAGTLRHIHVHVQVPDLSGPAKATFAKDMSPEACARRDKWLKPR